MKKKHYIDFNLCFDCEHCKKIGPSLKCDLNDVILAYSCKYFKETLYVNIDSPNLENENSKCDSLVENISEQCPRKIEHLVRCNEKAFNLFKKSE